MSADLHLYVFDPALTPAALVRQFLTYDDLAYTDRSLEEWEAASALNDELRDALFAARPVTGKYVNLIDDCWLGNVSWAKGGDNAASWRRWVPRSVEHVSAAYEARGGVVELTPGFAAHLLTGFNLPHTSAYENPRDAHGGTPKRSIYGRSRRSPKGVARARDVKKFLTAHVGLSSFVETW